VPYEDRFGFLPELGSLAFEVGAIEPVATLGKAKRWIARYANPDGNVYPPCGRKDSQASVFLWRLPASHRLRLSSAIAEAADPRYSLPGFIVHFLGLLYGRRCQFHDWWVDGRSPVRGDTEYAIGRTAQLADCLNGAVERWLTFSAKAQLIAINALFLHSRTVVYRHEWERFQAEYQILDALYSLAKESGLFAGLGKRPHGHPERLRVLCATFGLAQDSARARYFVDLRNALIHDALWDGRMPGEARSHDSVYASISLHKLTRRAAFAILGLQGEYLQSPWWHLGSASFDLRSG
jgi:hypothetical protein